MSSGALARDSVMMQEAYAEALAAQQAGEVPVGAVVVLDGEVIARGFNQTRMGCDPSAHAEIVAIRRAAQVVGNYRLVGAEVYVTLAPCVMCVGALAQARIARLVFGASDERFGAVSDAGVIANGELLNHKFKVVGGVMADDSRVLLQDFFRARRG